MKNIQVAEIKLNVLNSELFNPTVKKTINENILRTKNLHHSVLINDNDSPVISFYKKANISALIKKEYIKNGLKIEDVFFTSDFEKLNVNAYRFFLNNEYDNDNDDGFRKIK